MAKEKIWIGVDLGGTKVEAARIKKGELQQSERKLVRARGSQEEVLEDEEDHYDNGVENLKQFAKDPAKLAEFQEVFDRVMPNCVKRAFGRLEGPDNDFCLEHGLKRHKTEEIVNRYLEEMRGHMEGTGLMFPPMSAFEAINCGFLVGGTFLNRGHFDLIYHFIALVGCTVLIVKKRLATGPAPVEEAAYAGLETGPVTVRWKQLHQDVDLPRWERAT